MIGRLITKSWVILVVAILAILFLVGCSVNTINTTEELPTTFPLEYRVAEGQTLKYRVLGEQVEKSDVFGQAVEVESKGVSIYSFTSKGRVEGDLQFDVTIDEMNIQIQSTQGDFTPDTSPVIGKSFLMILSPLGEEKDVSGAEDIQFEAPSGARSVASRFHAFFPNLPAKAVGIGDSWTSQDKIFDQSDSGHVTIDLTNIHTVEGIETLDGWECLKITTQVTGRIRGEGNQQGMDYFVSGDYEGADTWYFAYEDGLLIKSISEGLIDAVTDITGSQDLTIPSKQEMKGETILIK